jgi:hypothetical protein
MVPYMIDIIVYKSYISNTSTMLPIKIKRLSTEIAELRISKKQN